MIGSPDLWPAVLPVVEALETLGVPYHVGGSVASSFIGIARATQDADLVADLQPPHAAPFARSLEERKTAMRIDLDMTWQTWVASLLAGLRSFASAAKAKQARVVRLSVHHQ
jgi:hypothetical protein